jgi:hypothetical protein
MTARWPDPDHMIIDHYLASLGLRSMKSRACYRQVLHGFQDVAERHSELGQDVLVAWLRVSAECRAASTLLHRTRIVDRFLDHLLKTEAIDRNPVTILREACNIKQCMPVWPRSGVAQSGTGPCRVAPASTVRQRAGRGYGSARRADAEPGIQIQFAVCAVVEVRPVPAAAPGAPGTADRGDTRPLGGGEIHAQSRRRM